MTGRLATITIIDEVNVKISGVDLDISKLLHKKWKFELPGVKYMPQVKYRIHKGGWDGTMSFYSQDGKTYVYCLKDTLRILMEAGYEFKMVDYRTPFNNTMQPIDADFLSSYSWDDGEPIKLRDYQVDAVNNFIRNPNTISVLATGSGKTVISGALIKSLDHMGRSIIIVPSRTLVSQTYDTLKLCGLDIGRLSGDFKEFDKKHLISTWQSLMSWYENKSSIYPMPIETWIEDNKHGKLVGILIDEAHVSNGKILRKLLTGIFRNIPLRWGLTATMPKEDLNSITIKTAIGEIINELPAHELQERGVLANCEINIWQMRDPSGLEFQDYSSEIAYLSNDPDRIKYLAGMIRQWANRYGNTLVLMDRISLTNGLLKYLPDASLIRGDISTKERQAVLYSLETENNHIILGTYGAGAVGLDASRIFCAVLLFVGKSYIRTLQSIGRGLRQGSDKNFLHVFDISSTTKFSARHTRTRIKHYKESKYKYVHEKIDWINNIPINIPDRIISKPNELSKDLFSSNTDDMNINILDSENTDTKYNGNNTKRDEYEF